MEILRLRKWMLAIVLVSAPLWGGCGGGQLVRVRTAPPGATIYLDDTKIGVSPCTVRIPGPVTAGRIPEIHFLEAKLPGHLSHPFSPGPITEISLLPRTISIKLERIPEGMEIDDLPDIPRLSRGPTKLMACDVRLVRVSDGAVLLQESAQESVDMMDYLAERLVQAIESRRPTNLSGRLAIASIRNRRETPLGAALSEQLTEALRREMNLTSRLRVAGALDLREEFEEKALDSTQILGHPNFEHLLGALPGPKADYLLMGGLAESIAR